jgi:hypothetical protein
VPSIDLVPDARYVRWSVFGGSFEARRLLVALPPEKVSIGALGWRCPFEKGAAVKKALLFIGVAVGLAAIGAGIAYAAIPTERTRPGPPAAYAYVSGDGSIVIGGDGVAHARNISDGDISHPATGVYCFTGLNFQPRAIVGTGTHETTLVSGQVVVPPNDTLVGCPDGATIRIRTTDSTTGAPIDARFFVWVED